MSDVDAWNTVRRELRHTARPGVQRHSQNCFGEGDRRIYISFAV